MIPANRLPNVRRRAERARNFPVNTCSASRHVMQIADAVRNGETFFMDDQDDAENAAGSLYSVLESLWKARTEIAKIKGKK